MKSIGLFWSKNDSEKKKCETCPYRQQETTEQTPSPKEENQTFDFQINLWNSVVKNVATGKVSRFKAIDFGVVCPLSTRTLIFLFPFEVKYEDFQDLVKCLSLDTDLLCTVFNDDLKSSSEPSKSYHTIDGLSDNSDIQYLMYELSKENIRDLSYDSQSNLTQLTISINSIFDVEQHSKYSLFLRFRIKLHNFDAFAKKKDVSNDWLQSAFSSTYMFDVRLNDVRELSKKRKELVEHQGFQLPEFRKIHFFYMTDSEEIVENGSSIKVDKRLLENDRWHSYLGDNLEFTTENIAHHWKKKEEFRLSLKEVKKEGEQKARLTTVPTRTTVKNFSIFFKTEFSDIRKVRVLGYLALIIILGIISSSVVSFISSFLPKPYYHEWGVWLCIIVLFVLVAYLIIKNTCKR